MAFRWRADDGPTLNAGLVAFCDFQGVRTSIAKEPYIFVIFQLGGGGGSGPPVPPLDSHMYSNLVTYFSEIKITCYSNIVTDFSSNIGL